MDAERMRMLQSEFESRYNPLSYNALHEPKKLSIEQRNFDFLDQQYVDAKEHKIMTSLWNGFKGTVRNIANYGIALEKFNESTAQNEQTLGINMPLAFRALYTAGNVLGSTGREKDVSLEEVAKSPLLSKTPVKGDTALGQFGLDLLENTPQVVAQVGLSIAAGPTSATAFMGSQIAGSQYERLNAEGVKFEDMKLPLITNVVVQGILEKTGMEKVLAKVPGGKGYMQKITEIIKRGVDEGFTEALQEFPEGVSDIIAKNPNASIGELTDKIIKAFPEMSKDAIYSGLIGGVFGAGFGGVKVLTDNINKHVDKEIHKERLNMLEEGAERIKKSGADPSYAASVVNANLQGEFVQVDGEVLYQYAQTQNINDVAETLGLDQEDIIQAAKSGQTIDISVGNFEAMVAKNADFMNAVKDSVTFEDDGYSVNNERLQKEIAKEYQKVKYNLDEFENWKTEKVNELRQSGATNQEALQAMVLLESAARTQYPDDPMQYFRDNPVSFKRFVSTPKGRYMQTKSANEKLIEDERNFAGIVDEYTAGKINDTKTYNVMTTPLALGLAGGKILPVTIDGSKIKHIFDGHSDGMTPELLKQVPRAMADPMMVLDSYAGRKVVVLDLKDAQGSTIIVPLELDVERNRYQVNAVSSAYGKGGENGTDYDWFIEHNLKKGRVSYINKEKTAKWLQSPGSDSASRGNDLDNLLNNSIPDENALRKRREEMQGYYQAEGKTKGSITWDEEGKAIISLFEGADASTVIHETLGHYLSVNIMRRSKLPTATEQMRKDRQTLLEYAESSEEEWAELDKYDGDLSKEQFDRKTAIYERWATGAEQYFMLGIAPSKDLRRIFANWKKWLLGIYKSIKDFVDSNKEYAKEITPEVRAVFDRALASEDAIIGQQKLDGYFAKLPDTIIDKLSETSKIQLAKTIENAYDKAVESLTKESLKNFTKVRK